MTYSGSNGNWNISRSRFTRFAFKYLFDVLKKIIENVEQNPRKETPLEIQFYCPKNITLIPIETFRSMFLVSLLHINC